MEQQPLNLGCGEMPLAGHVNIDSHAYAGVDQVLTLPFGLRLFAPASVPSIYAGHFLEHLAPWGITPLLQECYRILIPGGTLTLVTPDADKARLLMESHIMPPSQYALCVAGARNDDMPHYTLWNTARLRAALIHAGFQIDDSYRWQDDARVYDRRAIWQCGARGVKP